MKNKKNRLDRGRIAKFAQVSIEYLLLVGLAMAMVIPSVYLFSERQKSYEVEIKSEQINQVGNMIMDNVRTIYSLGRGSKAIVDVRFPKGINNMTIQGGRELVINVGSSLGGSDLVYTCAFCRSSGPSLNGSFTFNDSSEGKKTFRIRSCRNSMLIERVIRNSTGDFNSTGPVFNCDI